MPKALEKIVTKLKGKKGVDNPWALGNYILAKKIGERKLRRMTPGGPASGEKTK